MKYKICEFGGNTAVVSAINQHEAVKEALDSDDVRVFPDGYILLHGEPFGWVVVDE